MSDLGAKYTDEQIAKLEKQINIVYKEAEKDVTRKLKEFNKKSEKKAAELLKKRDAGEISDAEYQAWLKGNAFRGQQWQAKRDEICAVMHNSNKIATNMLNKSTMGVFSENANYLAYSLEHGVGVDFGFSLYDQTTVTNLIKDNPDLLPKWKVDAQKDYVWNKRKVNRSITQGIIQGESLDDITKRISTGLASNNKNLMSTFARTGLTGAQSSGRVTRIEEARKLGIDVQKEWMATLDGHTRTSHRILDGQIADDKGYFHAEGYKIRYPGDPQAHPSLVYNCRCTIVGNVKDYPDEYDRYDNIDGRPIKNMTYSEWKKAKSTGEVLMPTPFEQVVATAEDKMATAVAQAVEEAKAVEEPKTTVVQGKDISETWGRRKDEFDFEIEDVLDAQGFDGLPRVVPADEFEDLVKQANGGKGFIAQRSYSAPTQEILDEYREQLYNGKWYVDCSTGGAQYGQGMYAAADYTGELSSGIKEEMNHYRDLGQTRATKIIDNEQIDKAVDVQWGRIKSDISFPYDNDGKILHSEEEVKEELRKAISNLYGGEIEKLYGVAGNNKFAIENKFTYTETLTLDPSAKIIKYNDLWEIRQSIEQETKVKYVDSALNDVLKLKNLDNNIDAKTFIEFQTQTGNVSWEDAMKAHDSLQKAGLVDEVNALVSEANKAKMTAIDKGLEEWNRDHYKYNDLGVLAASKGYDAINAVGHGASGSYTVILNRTKVIFKGE